MPVIDICIWLAAFAGGLTALGVIWTKGLRPLYRFLRRIEDVHSLIIDELPSHMGDVRDFMASTAEWQANADTVLKQLQPNSGSSMFDRVKRIEQQLSQNDVETRGRG